MIFITRLKLLAVLLMSASFAAAQAPEGELKRWHKITLSFEGPNTSETANPNPFSDYRLDVTFTNGDLSYVVPGFYAGCNDAADSSCDSGTIWQVHFTPGKTGNWNWSAAFTSGSDVAVNGGGSSAGFMDGDVGSFTIEESDKSGRDFRSKNKGKLQYVGEHYLQHSGTDPKSPNGPWFVKAGADAPENTLAYNDFDNTPNRGGRRKDWNPHQQDYDAGDASGYTWKNGQGTELLGVVNYLSTKGLNAFSFLTLSLHGDDENVFPHLIKVSENVYNGYNDGQQWNQGVHKDRFDISKMAQWEKVFEYADKKGVFLHFKTLETENDNIMDDNTNGRQRKLYYRELIARFGHHLALNWNITEETTLPDNVTKSIASYIKDVDPYDNHIVLHTYPGQQDQRYDPLLGANSELTGASIQTDKNKVHDDVRRWLEKSRNAGKKWVVANDEQGSANIGVDQDGKEDKLVRDKVLWGALMAGGMGVEYYYGYQTGETDLTAQNHRSRDVKYSHASHALNFFESYLQEYLVDMVSSDGITSANDYVLAKPGEVYAIYLPDGGSTNIDLPSGTWQVQWYNPRSGGSLSAATAVSNTISAPDTNDWVALVKGESDGTDCTNTQNVVVAQDAYLQGTTLFNSSELRVESGNRVSYLQFVVPTPTETITGVKLQMSVSTDGGNGLIEVYKGTTNNWTESNLSDGNKPGEGALIGSLNTTYSEGQSYEWNLSGINAGETVSLVIRQTGGNDVSFSSKEGSNAPKLVLELDCTDGDGGGGDGNNTCAALEENGIVAVEAEHFEGQSKTDKRKWYFQDGTVATPTPDPDPSHHASASGDGYLEILPDTRVTHDDPLVNGESFSNTPGVVGILDYKVKFTTPGRYFVWVRLYSTGSEDNGIHVGIDGTWPASGQRMQWCAGKNEWTWESKQRTNANHCGEAQLIYIDVPSAGVHTISFSMREDGVEMDKFVLSQTYTKPNGVGPDEILVDCALSVNEFDVKEFSLYPNPAQNFINVKGLTKGMASVYDMTGREVMSSIAISESENNAIDISGIPSGVYFMVIRNKGNQNTLKFIKE
ncbi:DUF5060 domain-containing protein [uncultured Aquimarina sp.]|uniref:DUF5060 domain-containing protein n=1 Tax=uncultured Aquimarina sp. TaxID=575652 RepID=UPI0026164569|nr:DUF5060 domain-containing protein [uncultured Aquimarina sp.]